MTNICRCGTYQRIRAAVHMAAGTGKGGGSIIHMAADRRNGRGRRRCRSHLEAEEIAMKTTQARSGNESLAPQVHRRLRRRPAAGWRSASTFPLGIDPASPAAAQAAAGPEINAWVVDQARRHLRDPHRARRDGAGHAHRPRAARRRGARMRLEEGRPSSRSRPARTSPASASGGDMSTGGSRGIRGSQDYVRQGGAAARMMLLQAAADEWKVPVERADGGRTASSRTRPPERSTSYGKVAAAAAKLPAPELQEHQAQESAGVEGRRQADAAARHGRQGERREESMRSTSSCRACCTPRSRQCPVFGGKLVSYDEVEDRGPARRARRRAGERHDRRRRRRYLVAGEDRARRAADRVGRRRRSEAVERDDRRAPEGRPDRERRVRRHAMTATR